VREGLDHEVTKGAKDTKHEGRPERIRLGPGLRASWFRGHDSLPGAFLKGLAENFKVRFHFIYTKNARTGV
jgi:hypothetical protein